MKKPKLLIVDDNNLVLEITGDLFLEAGFDIVKRKNPVGTTAAVRKEMPDCVLLDINMPLLSGEKIVPLIKNNRKNDVKIILYSDLPESELARIAEETGADGYITKSRSKEEIVEKVRSAIEGRPAA